MQSTSIAPGDGEDPSTSESKADIMHRPAHFGWCAHHSGVMLQLSCIIQTLAIKCPTAFVHTRVAVKGTSSREGNKSNSPLDLLPVGLPDLPMVPNLRQDLQRKVQLINLPSKLIEYKGSVLSTWGSNPYPTSPQNSAN